MKVILPDERLENVVDEGGGGLRDVLSEFWNDFYEQCTLGNSFKDPYRCPWTNWIARHYTETLRVE